MIKSKLIPITSVLKDIYLLINESSVTEDMVMEFAIRGMEHLAVNQTYERAVCVLPVVNSQASYPKGMYGIHSVLGNQKPNDDALKYLVTSTTSLVVNEDGTEPANVQKTFEIVPDTEGSVLYKLIDFKSINFAQKGWKYLSLSNSPWDKSIVCAGSANLSSTCDDWFLPDNASNRFVVSFDYGYIAVSYFRFPQDSEGNFLIPDHPLVAEALETYVFSKLYQRLWHSSQQGAQQKYYHYLEKWQQLAAAATGELRMLSLPGYVNLTKDNTFFKDYASTKMYGGWGRQRTNFR